MEMKQAWSMQTVVRMQTVKLHPGRRYQLLTSGLRGKLHSLFGGFSEVLMGYRSVGTIRRCILCWGEQECSTNIVELNVFT